MRWLSHRLLRRLVYNNTTSLLRIGYSNEWISNFQKADSWSYTSFSWLKTRGQSGYRLGGARFSTQSKLSEEETVLFKHREVFLYRFANLIPLGQLAFSIYAGYLFFGPHYIHGIPSSDQTIGVSLVVYSVFMGICMTFVVATRWLTKGRVIEIRELKKQGMLRFYQHRYLGLGRPHHVQVKVGNIRVGNVERLLRFGALANKSTPGWLHLLWKQPLGTFPLQVITTSGKMEKLVMPIGEYDYLKANQLANLLVSGDMLSMFQERNNG
ncbi:hypothetical protein Gasu2_00060 [Galdieria sulphuraria]|uniref:Transmembrane protein n=1 Tax=Galdieria sulphuraria TaxID=130081 RepID=M2XTE7_GALSU|nr:uncharacterized protein Gasu_57170 [Galdieria sulphuraria]EME26714.1 hypothetical protein Gasu_57170 [Galdieria sulphuraria]GJD05540.1 hypothetical protein Gasu2_00060 [Galdieria sulphuraria]|eukprot:XP_005703234.1 hypothetical protein Gasu_57170 [Galdieria sulphuraria]